MSFFHLPPAASRSTLWAICVVLTALSLSGCGNMARRLSEVGTGPQISPTQNPTERADYKPVSMPMPAPSVPPAGYNSLWRPGSRTFFKDQRASQVGDILTVGVNISDQATMQNSTTANRTGTEAYGAPDFLGLGKQLSTILPGDKNTSLSTKLSLDSSSGSTGSGNLSRNETISVQVAAVVTQILPNGNMVIAGRQEVRINSELRELTVTGVIRQEDIDTLNTVTSEKIAEARIYYGGRGILSDVQEPRYGQQIFDIIFPF